MSRKQLEPYRPSNGTEGEYFMSEFCYRCKHDEDYDNPCSIIGLTMGYDLSDPEYPKDTWVYFNGKPTCLAFKERGGKDDPVNKPLPVDPNQYDLFIELPVVEAA